jgi:N-acetylglucosamine malate deacetylase 1
VTNVVEFVPGAGRVVLVITAHADDATLFLGGTIARWSDAGWKVVVVRVTDDRWDSFGLSEADTIATNKHQFAAALDVLGVAEVVELGYATDVLADANEVELREKIIRLIRIHRPYALVSFDPYAMYHEDNQDHVMVAAATDEAFWTAQFDKHHPEHLAEGLEPHGVFERWYFGRRVIDVTDVVDIGSTIDRKISAALCHDAMLRNLVNQLRLQARTGGWRIPLLDDVSAGELAVLIDPMLREQARSLGEHHGVGVAEGFRVVRFGGLGDLLERFGERLPPSA